MEPIIKYSWQQALLDAFVETDPDQLREKIAVAEIVISARERERFADLEERLALSDALRSLQILIRETKSDKKNYAA